MSDTLSIASLILSIIAVVTSTLFLVRQTLFMRHANEIPISVDLYQEFRSVEFQSAEEYVLKSLAANYEPSIGLSNLPDEARNATYRVAAFYSSLGALVALGMADERFAVSLLGDAAERDWRTLEPYIFRERELCGDAYVFAFYEDLVCRTRENYPVTEAYGLKFKRVGDGYPPLPGPKQVQQKSAATAPTLIDPDEPNPVS
jgi:hypothetical protein